MMRRAGGYSQEDQLKILYENMNPDYQLYVPLKNVTSVEELEAKVAGIDKIQARRGKRTPQPEAARNRVAAVAYDRT